MNVWRSIVADSPIVTRLVLAVSGTMAVVLLAAGGFVFWRVQFALDRQVDQDLEAYQEVVERAVTTGDPPPADTPGQSYQVYDVRGGIVGGNAVRRLADRATVARAAGGVEHHEDVGRLIPPAAHPYRVETGRVKTDHGTVVVAAAISRHKHDEALRELLIQLGIADLATLVAASFVGYRTARAALNPVERYRVAAERSDGASLLPVDAGRDDEIARLGHTFNDLLVRIERSNVRERQFLADAAHELRSPLALMRTELEMALLRSRGETETRASFESLRDQVERLVALSNALLDLEELRASGASSREPIVLRELVDDVTERFAARAAEANRQITTHVADGVVVDGNRHWLDLALGNLLSNALQHGAGTVDVTATQSPRRTHVTVTDEGAGAPAEFVGRAFDRFTRADASRATPGTGLGLALVLAVAEAHDGVAVIDGSAVSIELPTSGGSS
jgi:signal transduction histidine kinase